MGPNGEQMAVSARELVYGRLLEPAYLDGKTGAEAAFLLFDAKTRLDAVPSWEGGCFVELEEEDWRRIKLALEKPKNDFDQRIAHCLAPQIRAILEAPNRNPEL